MDERLSYDDERALMRQAQDGDRRAQQRLWTAFRPMVRRLIQACLFQIEKAGAPMAQIDGIDTDLEQEAAIAFFQAVQKFDLSYGARFAGYARVAVIGAVVNAALESAPVRFTSRAQDRYACHEVLREDSGTEGCTRTAEDDRLRVRSAFQAWAEGPADAEQCGSDAAQIQLERRLDHQKIHAARRIFQQQLPPRSRQFFEDLFVSDEPEAVLSARWKISIQRLEEQRKEWAGRLNVFLNDGIY